MDADSYAASYAAALDVHEASRPRTIQRELGVSDVGYCRAKAQWKLTGVEPTDSPPGRQAPMGSAVHTYCAEARGSYKPHLLLEQELTVTMPSGRTLVGHADEIDPTEPGVTDLKTKAGAEEMVALRRTGSDEQQQWQRMLYAHGAIQAGLLPAEGVVVRNVWIDRSGQDPMPYVEQEPYDPAVVEAADAWLGDVAYAIEYNDEPSRDKHYAYCRMFCEFFSHCRTTEHPDMVITDPELVQAAEYALAGRVMKKEGEALEKAGKVVLGVLKPDPGGDVVAYAAGDVRVRWSWVNKVDGGHFVLHLDPA